jgi:choline dehydrogenase-like flavoprotein
MLGSIGRHSRGFFLAGFGDMLSAASNAVTIDPTRRDAWGIPVARVDCAHSANDRALIADMTETMHEIATAAGLRIRASLSDMTSLRRRATYAALWHQVVTPDGAFHPGGAIHEMGGARMGDDPKASVLNRHNQSWDVPNLFVTDAACFVSSGHQSHTLTIMALTVRACEFIVTQSRAGLI